MNQRLTDALAGGAAGLAGGLFGGGGGMVLLPILSHQGHLEGRQVYATCIGVIFPACVISAVVYLLRGGVALSEAARTLPAGWWAAGWVRGSMATFLWACCGGWRQACCCTEA